MEISKEQLIKIQYDKEKSTPGLAWLNLFGLSLIGGLGYYCTAKGDSDQIMKGAAWSATSLILFIMGRSYLINYTGLVVSAVCIYLFLIADTIRLFFERKKHNAAILQKITDEINSRAKEKDSHVVDNSVAFTNQEQLTNATEEPSKTAPAKTRMTEEEFQNMVITLNNDRVRNGYEPLPVSKFDYIDYVGKEDKKD